MEKGGIRVMVVQTDTQTWTDTNLLVSVFHSVCTQAVMLSHSVLYPLHDSFVLCILIPFLPLSLIVAVTLRVGPAISVTITPHTFTDDYRTEVRQMIS